MGLSTPAAVVKSVRFPAFCFPVLNKARPQFRILPLWRSVFRATQVERESLRPSLIACRRFRRPRKNEKCGRRSAPCRVTYNAHRTDLHGRRRPFRRGGYPLPSRAAHHYAVDRLARADLRHLSGWALPRDSGRHSGQLRTGHLSAELDYTCSS